MRAKRFARIGVDTLLICRRDMDEGLVYEVTKEFFDGLVSGLRTTVVGVGRIGSGVGNVDSAARRRCPLLPRARTTALAAGELAEYYARVRPDACRRQRKRAYSAFAWMTKRILVVEDDPSLSRVLRDNLLFEKFEVELVADGRLALDKAKAFGPDLIVLDISLPGVNGFELCAALRKRSSVPILILTARSQKADKLRGLNLGADDYITKPFDLEEFLARVKAILRRARPTSDALVLGAVTIDFVSRTARRGRTELHLTHREFEILQYLAERQGQVVHRDELLRELWGIPRRRSPVRSTTRLCVFVRRLSPITTAPTSSIPCTATATR